MAERHATITAQGNRHFIQDMGSVSGTSLNNQKITKEPLHDGDIIVIGKTRFMFRDKATRAASFYQPGAYNTGVQIPDAQHVCPFCGSVKDAGGNCNCTVGSAPAQNGMPTDFYMPTVQTPAQSAPISNPTIPISSAGMSQGARLTAVAGPYSGQTFVLKSGETHIGRDAAKDIGLPMDNTVSRSHARIALEAGGYVLYDAGSTNGAFVNGARVTRYELNTGDVVQIGSTKFKFEQ